MPKKEQRESNYKLDHLIALMEKVAIPIPAIPAIPSIPPIPAIPAIITSGDHDLLTKLDTKVDQIQADVTVLKNQDKNNITQTQHQDLCDKAEDHETRIRNNESNITKILTWGSALILIIGIAEFVINKVYH